MASHQLELELQQTESTPLVNSKIKPLRQIIKCVEPEYNQPRHSLPRFGPVYRKDPSLERIDKEKTWQHVLRNSPDREAITTEFYMSAMRDIETKARETYGGGIVDGMTGSQFRWMMIKDGCLFLQMALFILGRSKQLGYPPDDELFGKKHNSKEMTRWIKSMFFVGNQIPFLVLKELMKQRFFQNVITEGKWDEFSDLSKRVLHRFLVSPAVEQPIDLIHALQLLVLGPEIHDTTEEEEEEDDEEDEEEEINESEDDKIQNLVEEENAPQPRQVTNPIEERNATQPRQVIINLDGDNKTCPSATELNQQGMNFEVCSSPIEVKTSCFSIKKRMKACKYLKFVNGMGSRGITYVSSMFSTALFLPPLMADNDTELLLQCLMNYEKTQPLDKKKREFSSYLRFLTELIRTPEDANLLHSKGIIHGSRRNREKLPGIFKKLVSGDKEKQISGDKYNHSFSVLTLRISDYNRPSWKNLQHILGAISFLTVVQTVYAVVAYHTGK